MLRHKLVLEEELPKNYFLETMLSQQVAVPISKELLRMRFINIFFWVLDKGFFVRNQKIFQIKLKPKEPLSQEIIFTSNI
jgi:hypothetical protein